MLYLNRSHSTLLRSYTQRQTAADISSRLDRAQQELSTGYKADVWKSLGLGAAEALDLRAARQSAEAQVSTNSLLSNRMETMSSTLGAIREGVGSVMALAAANSESDLGTAAGIQVAARAALAAVIGQANTTYGGVALFAGTGTDRVALQPWDSAGTAGGAVPAEEFAAVLAGGMGDAAATEAVLAQVDDFFATRYDTLLYTGGTARLSAATGEGAVMDYGLRASDDAFRDVIRGLAMLAATDVSQIEDAESYKLYMGEAMQALSTGSAGLLREETQLGTQVGLLEEGNERLRTRLDLYNSRILDLEGVDSYEAATRITNLQTQLQASYAVTSTLAGLSFLNWM